VRKQVLRSAAHVAAGGVAILLATAGAVAAARPADSAIMVLAAPANGSDPVQSFSQGVIALQAGRFEEAAGLLKTVSDASPDNPAVWRFLGASRAGLKDWPGSRAAYETAVRLDPSDVGAHAGLGVALTALSDPTAKAQLDWMEERVKACAGHCPDADYLAAMLTQVRAVAAGQPPAPVL